MVFGAADQVIINEIAWMGTAANSADEWLELYNPAGEEVDLSGWQLFEAGGTTLIITLSGKIAPGGYFLIERSDDNSVADITADVFGPFGGSGLNNNGEFLVLKNTQGEMVDQIDASSGWPAGESATKSTMERRSDGAWQTNDGVTINGRDVGGNAIIGTPKAANSGAGLPPDASGSLSQSGTTTPSSQSSVVGGSSSGSNINPVGLKAEAGSDVVAEVGQNILFNGASSQGASSYKWYLGDGAVGEGASISHSYLYPGVYLVTLEVGNSSQAVSWDQLRVYVYGGKVLINEFSAAGSQWLELYNPSSQTANIGGWILEGGGRNFALPAFVVIPPKGFLALAKQITGLDLSAADSVRLKYPSGAVVDEVKFQKPSAAFDAVAARGNNGFYWTKEATPGEANIVLAVGSVSSLNTLVMSSVAAVNAPPQQAISNLVKSSYNEVTDSLAAAPASDAADSYEAAVIKSGRWRGVLGGLGFWVVLAIAVGGVIGGVYAVASRRWSRDD